MNRKILLQVAAPTVLIGLVLFVACLLSAWHVNRLQMELTNFLKQNVSSLKAGQELETNVRRLQFHSFLYLIDPNPKLLAEIQADQKLFEEWLETADEYGTTAEEKVVLRKIHVAYHHFQDELKKMRQAVSQFGPRKDLRSLAGVHPINEVVDPCRYYAKINQEMMVKASEENNQVSQTLRITLLFLGIGGPLGGLLSGFGIARGLSQSLYRLSVRVQDMAQSLEKDVGAIRLTPEGDVYRLDEQIEYVVKRVAAVGEQLQRQQQEILRAQQLSAVGQLAASVAHEVRNPLTSIKMLVEAGMRQHKPRPFTQENLGVVHGEILRLEQTVQGFLDFARPPALQRHPADLRQVIQQALDLVRARARQQKVVIDVQFPDRPITCLIDRGQLCTVLVNLFINALDAMPQGGTLEVQFQEGAKGISVSVLDSGEGVDADMMRQLFTPFVSGKPTGSGLGLTISKRIVEDHGGQLSGGNRPAGGASFTIELPAFRNEESHAVAAHH